MLTKAGNPSGPWPPLQSMGDLGQLMRWQKSDYSVFVMESKKEYGRNTSTVSFNVPFWKLRVKWRSLCSMCFWGFSSYSRQSIHRAYVAIKVLMEAPRQNGVFPFSEFVYRICRLFCRIYICKSTGEVCAGQSHRLILFCITGKNGAACSLDGRHL